MSIVPCYQPQKRELALVSILLVLIFGCLSRFSKVSVELELQGASTNLIQVESDTKTINNGGKKEQKYNDQQNDAGKPMIMENKNKK